MMPPAHFVRIGLRKVFCAALVLGLGLAWLWALLALWSFAGWPAWLRGAAAMAWVAGTAWCWFRFRRPDFARTVMVGVLAVLLLWCGQRPSNDRPWTTDQRRLPSATFRRDRVTIDNLRYTTYRRDSGYDVIWYRRQFDLATLERVDFVIQPFTPLRGPAHTLLTFGFSDGSHVAISVEIRREQGETYSPLKGLFRNYEIMYVIGDERDLIGLQLEVGRSPVYLYPIKATRQQVRALFVAMLERANRLHRQPEFYNTITNTCTTNIVRHFEDLTGERLPMDWRVLLPGYSDDLAFERGLIETPGARTGSQARDREQFRIRPGTDLAIDARSWSAQIRRGTQ